MKILHLVLFNDSPTYLPMYHHSRAWYKECESLGVETWYYRFNSNITTPSLNLDTMILELPGVETYIPGILHKTLAAFRVCVERRFDLLVRSNISTVVNFHSLLQHYSQVANTDMLYAGPHVMSAAENKELGHQTFVQGTCMLFAPKIVNMLLKHAKQLCQTAEDDIAIGALLKKHNVLPIQVGRQFIDFSPFQNVNSVSAFRNHEFHSDRKGNIANIRLEVNALFQRYVFLKEPKRVANVLYFNQNVTNSIKALFQNNHWTTNQTNRELDTLFGDPMPNVNKTLMVYFYGDEYAPLTQRCDLRFFLHDRVLFVQ